MISRILAYTEALSLDTFVQILTFEPFATNPTP